MAAAPRASALILAIIPLLVQRRSARSLPAQPPPEPVTMARAMAVVTATAIALPPTQPTVGAMARAMTGVMATATKRMATVTQLRLRSMITRLQHTATERWHRSPVDRPLLS